MTDTDVKQLLTHAKGRDQKRRLKRKLRFLQSQDKITADQLIRAFKKVKVSHRAVKKDSKMEKLFCKFMKHNTGSREDKSPGGSGPIKNYLIKDHMGPDIMYYGQEDEDIAYPVLNKATSLTEYRSLKREATVNLRKNDI